MYTSNDDTQIYPFSRLELVVETYGHSTHSKVPKNVKPTNKIMSLWNFGDWCNKQHNVPLSLFKKALGFGTRSKTDLPLSFPSVKIRNNKLSIIDEKEL